ncbi:hypothetical protein C8A05DRAFT_43089 [Staphylotrichum tortipilum]|uniref:RecQ mediated genome instability protein 1-like N-terminal helical domain-containing protein n=1 Tax=Staphylotrichum tortipilum TaxID=2831512 RepID=A0AAN6MNY8_9PEZI|nr:hypothetical protein C8A05DRAFT_43089 [Staphylotrichum longicolle]
MDDIPHQLLTSLSTTTTPLPSLPWLLTLLSTTRQPPPPLASLLATVRTRLLASDLTTPNLLDADWAAGHCFPPSIAGGNATGVRETKLQGDVVVQVLDVEDVARGRWEVVEEMERVERGEGRRGREVVRLAAAAGEENPEGEEGTQQASTAPGPGSSSTKNSTHKLLIQDCRGHKLDALELRRVERLGVGSTLIGEKILLRKGTVVARGVVLLEPAQCVLLGGKVEAWHREWVAGRLGRLREAVSGGGAGGGRGGGGAGRGGEGDGAAGV